LANLFSNNCNNGDLPTYFEITCHFLKLLFAEASNMALLGLCTVLHVITCRHKRTQDQSLVSRVIELYSFLLRHDRVVTPCPFALVYYVLIVWFSLHSSHSARTHIKLLNPMHNSFSCTCECWTLKTYPEKLL